jgi:hypothetical protein
MDGDRFQHIFLSDFDMWQNLEFLIYNEKKSTLSNFNYYMMTLGQRKI